MVLGRVLYQRNILLPTVSGHKLSIKEEAFQDAASFLFLQLVLMLTLALTWPQGFTSRSFPFFSRY